MEREERLFAEVLAKIGIWFDQTPPINPESERSAKCRDNEAIDNGCPEAVVMYEPAQDENHQREKRPI